MADPLSIISSTAGLVTVIGSLTTTVSPYITAAYNVPPQVRVLHTHLSTLKSVLLNLKNFLDVSPDTVRAVPPQSVEALRDVLGECMTILVELQGFVDRVVNNKGGRLAKLGRRLQWVFKEKDIEALIECLKMHQGTISLTLTIAT